MQLALSPPPSIRVYALTVSRQPAERFCSCGVEHDDRSLFVRAAGSSSWACWLCWAHQEALWEDAARMRVREWMRSGPRPA